MSMIRANAAHNAPQAAPEVLSPEVTAFDEETFTRITSVELTAEQIKRVGNPLEVHARQDSVLAVHWHPEHVPMELILRRVAAMFPSSQEELIIPTQHNEFLSHAGYSGVEVDCYSHGFNRKVQLLLHFKQARLSQAGVLRGMIEHTRKYRASQLFEFVETLTDARFEDRLVRAAAETNADEEVVDLSGLLAGKLRELLRRHEATLPFDAFKNKLVRNFFDAYRGRCGERMIAKCQVFIKGVKEIVKESFPLTYFYRASEIIEEVRSIGGGIVIPHPEQFWPILLADYDVDGYEVWNPQSRQYTEFMINVVNRENKTRRGSRREVLVFMGDDCHLSEKLRDPAEQDPEKAAREVGYQPAWDEPAIRKSLVVAGFCRKRTIEEYRARLD